MKGVVTRGEGWWGWGGGGGGGGLKDYKEVQVIFFCSITFL